MTAYELVRDALQRHGRVERNGEWQCPAHDDSTPSLGVHQGDKGAIVKCQAGCETPDVMAALGLTMADLFDRTESARPTTEAVYDYIDEAGVLLFQVERQRTAEGRKKFLQRRPDGHGGWIYKLGDTRRVLYRLPQILMAIGAGDTVWLVEGEKDVHTLEGRGETATTNPGGAGKWRPDYTSSLAGATVTIIADRDEPGRKHACHVAEQLRLVAQVTVVEPTLGKDISEHLALGGTLEQLVPLVDDEFQKPPIPPTIVVAVESEPNPGHRTDVGNALRLAALCEGDYRYVHAWGTWLHWDGRRWAKDAKASVVEQAKRVARQRIQEATTTNHPDAKTRRERIMWAFGQESRSRIEAMISLARSVAGIPIEPDELDADPWVLNTLDGVLDLRTGQLLSHDPKRLITKLAGRYDPDADYPRWRTFLGQIIPDLEVQEFLARWAGYCLTGNVYEHKLMFAFGVGANGKSTFTNTLSRAMGDYARQAAPDLLMRRRDDPHPTGLADLHGARLVLATETAQDRKLDEALVKKLTGGDVIKARYMHRDFFEFPPTHKIIVATNHRPEVDGTDHGIWRRIRLVPFTVTIDDDDQDHQLEDKLAAETPGILRWAVEGCLRWADQGLSQPHAVTIATADYRADMDILGDYLSDCCILNSTLNSKASDLWKTYLRWCEMMGEQHVSQRSLGQKLRERGLDKYTSNGVWWQGIGLKPVDHGTMGEERDPQNSRSEDF